MKVITLRFPDDQAQFVEKTLRARYGGDGRTNLRSLCRIAIFREIVAELDKEQEHEEEN
jgi:hypothetical protein